jgi:site-specific DNA-methyltransferase (adenine-specific)
MIDLRKGDCLEVMKGIESGSIDAIITDPPYGTTACKWDSVINFDLMWEQLNRIIKPNGAIVLFGSEPFSSALRMSNIKNYKYDWIWEKSQGVNFAQCNHMPMSVYETISVFGKFGMSKNAKVQPIYNPQNLIILNKNKKAKTTTEHRVCDNNKDHIQKYGNYPRQIQRFSSERGLHPTQKPIALMEYLIKTYTNENETVLDFTMGSGSTGVACVNTNRNFIGIEQDDKYFDIATERINKI